MGHLFLILDAGEKIVLLHEGGGVLEELFSHLERKLGSKLEVAKWPGGPYLRLIMPSAGYDRPVALFTEGRIGLNCARLYIREIYGKVVDFAKPVRTSEFES